jgi:hypothetical protein
MRIKCFVAFFNVFFKTNNDFSASIYLYHMNVRNMTLITIFTAPHLVSVTKSILQINDLTLGSMFGVSI